MPWCYWHTPDFQLLISGRPSLKAFCWTGIYIIALTFGQREASLDQGPVQCVVRVAQPLAIRQNDPYAYRVVTDNQSHICDADL